MLIVVYDMGSTSQIYYKVSQNGPVVMGVGNIEEFTDAVVEAFHLFTLIFDDRYKPPKLSENSEE